MQSSLVFAPNQGIQLVDPSYIEEQSRKLNQQSAVFKDSGFKTVINERAFNK